MVDPRFIIGPSTTPVDWHIIIIRRSEFSVQEHTHLRYPTRLASPHHSAPLTQGLRTLTTVWAQVLSKEVKRRFYKNWYKAKQKAFTKYTKK